MRFDDSLKTVLSAETLSGFGAQAAWRQLVDLIGRGRAPADEPAIARLRMLRQAVPDAVRAASARALAFADPPAALVGVMAEDDLAIAAPVLRMATLDDAEWAAILPRLTPPARSVLRHRRDLSPATQRALESFGATDFVLPDDTPKAAPAAVPESPSPPPILSAPLSESPFVALGDVARGLPVVAEALRQADAPATEPARFEIADLVARIDAFNREREGAPVAPRAQADSQAAPDADPGFRYETDAAGAVRWVEGVARGALVGLCFAHAAPQGDAQIDGIVAGAYRRRSPFRDARLVVGGTSDAAGAWRMSGLPAFDAASGRFLGYRGAARRPRADESAAPITRSREASDSLRQLVHELRTPTNAIAGFAELIETELLGPVAETYRTRAGSIRGQAIALLEAIEDLDTAARIEGDALDLRVGIVSLRDVVDRAIEALTPLARLRGSTLAAGAGPALSIVADDRAVERLVGRLLAALVSATAPGEHLAVQLLPAAEGAVALVVDRPQALRRNGDAGQAALLSIDADPDAADGAPLLGTGFALRLAQNLAAELGGGLTIDADRLTLRLPASWGSDVEQASTC